MIEWSERIKQRNPYIVCRITIKLLLTIPEVTMKELNTMEVEQVAGGGLVSDLLGEVASTVNPLVNELVQTTIPNAVSSVATGVNGILTALF
ncbi:hypothetical protein SPM24T3_08209 [Serratia sp. M24T3]|nr:hypothetical protein SPM24T3_08209 [Serratia sp. M24T3]